MFLDNVFKQLAQEALKVSQNQTGSGIVEELVHRADRHQLISIMEPFSQDWETACCDRFASYVTQAMVLQCNQYFECMYVCYNLVAWYVSMFICLGFEFWVTLECQVYLLMGSFIWTVVLVIIKLLFVWLWQNLIVGKLRGKVDCKSMQLVSCYAEWCTCFVVDCGTLCSAIGIRLDWSLLTLSLSFLHA